MYMKFIEMFAFQDELSVDVTFEQNYSSLDLPLNEDKIC